MWEGADFLVRPADGALRRHFLTHMFSSLMAGEDGNLYFSAFTGETNELYYMTYDEAEEKYLAVKVGDMGKDVWPATITSVTVNGGNAANAAAPKPEYTMSSVEISREELETASSRKNTTQAVEEQIKQELITNAAGTKADPIPFVEGDTSEGLQGG